MNIEIVEITQKYISSCNDAPLTYRLKIKLEKNKIVLYKEKFRFGFCDYERFDVFTPILYSCGFHGVSIITRNIDNKYINDLEREIYIIFYNELEKYNNKTILELEKHVKYKEEIIKTQNNILKDLSFVKRKDKLKILLSKNEECNK